MTNLWDDKLHEECGVFGIYGHAEASRLTYLGLYALQHRGQESCGIAVSNGEHLVSERGMGYVSEAFDQVRLDRMPGPSAIGHVRYSTAGEDHPQGAPNPHIQTPSADHHQRPQRLNPGRAARDS